MATRKRSAPPPSPPPPPPPPTPWELFWREVAIAGAVAGSITVVLLARRWMTMALGTGALNQEFFAGNLAVGTLVAAVEARMEGGSSRAERQSPPTTRAPGAGVSGDPDDEATS